MTTPTLPDGARPFFLLGAPRSGTTYATKLLDAHPDVLMTNEVRIFTFFEHAFAEIPTGDRGGLHCSRSFGPEFVATLRTQVRTIVEQTFARIAISVDKPQLRYWGDKNPHHSSALELIEEAFPDAVYLRMQRDPRDVVCSIAEMHGKMVDAEATANPGMLQRLFGRRRPEASGARQLRTDNDDALVRSASAVGHSIQRSIEFLDRLPAERRLEVCYEDLVANPEPWIERIFGKFLGLEDLGPVREFVRDRAGKDAHARFEQTVDFKSRSIGRWKRDLTASQIALVETALGPALERDRYDA